MIGRGRGNHHVRAWSRLRFLCENPQPNINPLSTQLEIHTFLSYFWQGEREKRDGGEGAPMRQHRHLEGRSVCGIRTITIVLIQEHGVPGIHAEKGPPPL